MTDQESPNTFDVIIIGSGMGSTVSKALSASTPVPGLCLSGQDVWSPGMAGGMLGAGAIDPRVFQNLK